MEEPFEGEEPFEPDPAEPIELTPQERRDIEADLDDLGSMRGVFSQQGVKGVVIACQDCGQNHFYEWELMRDNLEHMLSSGEPRMHEPAFNVREDEYVQWDYAKGYVDSLADLGLGPETRVEVTQCPWCETAFLPEFQYCPRCGRALGPVRLFAELVARGIPEREVKAMMVRAGFEPF